MEAERASPAMYIVSPLLRSLYLLALIVGDVLCLPTPIPATSSIGLTPDGTTLFVVNPDSGSVSAIDTASETMLAELIVGIETRVCSPSDQTASAYTSPATPQPR